VEGVRRNREKRYLVKEERATDDFLRMDAAVMEVDEEEVDVEVDVEKDAVLLEVEVEDGGISFFFSDGVVVLDLIDWEVEDEGDDGAPVIVDDNVVVAADEVDDDEVDISSDLDLAADVVVDNDRIIIIVFIVCDE
jgi:hypothetical protein